MYTYKTYVEITSYLLILLYCLYPLQYIVLTKVLITIGFSTFSYILNSEEAYTKSKGENVFQIYNSY